MLVLCAALVLVILCLFRLAASDLAAAARAGNPAPAPDAVLARADQASPDPRISPATPSPTGRQTTLCAPPAGALYLSQHRSGVAAAPSGAFHFYGQPDPLTGRPGEDSHDLLRGCLRSGAGPTPPNPASVAVDGGERRTLDADPLARPTTREADRLVTRYRLQTRGGVVAVEQVLRLIPPGGRFSLHDEPDTLLISYRLTNLSPAALSVDLSAALTPARGPSTTENSGVPYLAIYPNGFGREVVTETVLGTNRGGVPKEIVIPRPGVAADSTCYWRPVKTAPDAVVFGSDASVSRPGYRPAPGRALGYSSGVGLRWRDLHLAPGARAAVSYAYGPSSGWPRPEPATPEVRTKGMTP